jgi:hypothetical protein
METAMALIPMVVLSTAMEATRTEPHLTAMAATQMELPMAMEQPMATVAIPTAMVVIPMEQPTAMEMVIQMAQAMAMGIPTVLLTVMELTLMASAIATALQRTAMELTPMASATAMELQRTAMEAILTASGETATALPRSTVTEAVLLPMGMVLPDLMVTAMATQTGPRTATVQRMAMADIPMAVNRTGTPMAETASSSLLQAIVHQGPLTAMDTQMAMVARPMGTQLPLQLLQAMVTPMG